MVREMTSLKAVEEPMLMSARRQEMVTVVRMEIRGMEARGSTFFSVREMNMLSSAVFLVQR